MSEYGEKPIFFFFVFAPVVSRIPASLEADIIGSINNPQYFVLSFSLCIFV